MNKKSFLYQAARKLRNRINIIRLRVWGVHPSTLVVLPTNVSQDVVVGKYSYIGPNAEICTNVHIGDFVMLASGVKIVGGDHRIDLVGIPMVFSGREIVGNTVIEDDCWIGTNVVILRGISIGCGSVVAAGAVVTKDVPENCIVGGVPARKIRKRFSAKDFDRHMLLFRQADIEWAD